MLDRALKSDGALAALELTPAARRAIAAAADGDARVALNALELAAQGAAAAAAAAVAAAAAAATPDGVAADTSDGVARVVVDEAAVREAVQRKVLYDRDGEMHQPRPDLRPDLALISNLISPRRDAL